jgi:uncharacterized membrane protein (DUF4010 family)
MVDFDADPVRVGLQFLTSLAVGLLLGLERQRNPSAKAGLRTFALVALFGTVNGLLAEKVGSPWILAVGLLLVGAMIIASYAEQNDPGGDSGTTTVIAVLLCYCLGVMIWYDQRQLAVALAIVATILLYFKTELHGISARLTSQDITSILQFAVLSFIVLPLLPNRGYGPYTAINPYHVWLMVVLVSGVSLVGYLALRFLGDGRGALLTGLLGGLVSSTATTLVHARQARRDGTALAVSSVIIVVANLVVLLRLAVIVGVADVTLLGALGPALLGGVMLGAPSVLLLRRNEPESSASKHAFANPTQLKVALGFGLVYATVLLASAWMSTKAGALGLYAVAFVSGLTDVDAITLSSVQLVKLSRIAAAQAVGAIVLAFVANMLLKGILIVAIGGVALARRCVLPMVFMTGGTILGFFAMRS